MLFRLLGYLIAPKTKPKYQLLFQNVKNSSSIGVSFFTRDQKKKKKQGVCHNVALPFTLKCILRQNKNYVPKLKYFTLQKYT
jgi:hypothetical protein